MRKFGRRKVVLSVVAVAAFGVVGITAGQAYASVWHGGGHTHGAARYHSGFRPIPRPSVSPSATPVSPTPTTPAPASTRPASSPTHAATTKPATTAPTGSSSVTTAILNQINQYRAANGLPAYTLLSGLNASAHAHNVVMMGGCGLSHQCSGEAAFGDRISAQGVRWSSAGENIGEGGPVANTTAAITSMAQGLTTSMYNETPPNDGHRKNILSTSFTHVGIDVVRDANGTVWMTQDFTN